MISTKHDTGAIVFNQSDAALTSLSNPIAMFYSSGFSAQVKLSGAPNGSLYLEWTNDLGDSLSDVSKLVNWQMVDGTTIVIAAAGIYSYWVQDPPPVNWMRIRWAPAGGTGSISGRFVAKVE